MDSTDGAFGPMDLELYLDGAGYATSLCVCVYVFSLCCANTLDALSTQSINQSMDG